MTFILDPVGLRTPLKWHNFESRDNQQDTFSNDTVMYYLDRYASCTQMLPESKIKCDVITHIVHVQHTNTKS